MQNTKSISEIIQSCDSAILGTCDNSAPDVRHVTNILNRESNSFDLYFITTLNSPKYNQINQNTNVCLYYYNPMTHKSVRLYGIMNIISDIQTKKAKWHKEFIKFGYTGYTDTNFVLLNFVPKSYKFYIDNVKYVGKLN